MPWWQFFVDDSEMPLSTPTVLGIVNFIHSLRVMGVNAQHAILRVNILRVLVSPKFLSGFCFFLIGLTSPPNASYSNPNPNPSKARVKFFQLEVRVLKNNSNRMQLFHFDETHLLNLVTVIFSQIKHFRRLFALADSQRDGNLPLRHDNISKKHGQ